MAYEPCAYWLQSTFKSWCHLELTPFARAMLHGAAMNLTWRNTAEDTQHKLASRVVAEDWPEIVWC